MIKSCFLPVADRLARVAILMSGTGSNAEILLNYLASSSVAQAVVIATDAPEESRTKVLADKFNKPMLGLDIRKYYREHGENSIRLDSPQRREIRRKWSKRFRELLFAYQPDFVAMAGFMPLIDLAEYIPCLNVHPGDLTLEENGRRIFAGLYWAPVEQALLRGMSYARSSVILVQPYHGDGKNDMDSGPVLGVSTPVSLVYKEYKPLDLQNVFHSRIAPPYTDELRKLSKENLENLKRCGDHVVFPQVVEAFAMGKYGYDNTGLWFHDGVQFQKVRTVEFSQNNTWKIIQ